MINFISYFLTKLIPLIVLPSGVILFLLLSIRNKSTKIKLFSVILIFWSFSTGLISNSLWALIEHPYKRIDSKVIKKSNAIVVLSGGGIHIAPGDKEYLEWKDPDRFFAGIQLYRDKNAPRLIFTGGINPFNPNNPSEDTIYIKKAIEMNIPSDSIYSTSSVMNTYQEAKSLKDFIKRDLNSSFKDITLVTSAFHMKRAKKIFEREGFIVNPFPVDFKRKNLSKLNNLIDPYLWFPNSDSLASSSRVIRELIGRLIYRVW